MISDRITEDADWRDGMNVFRANVIKRLNRLEAQIEMLMERIKDVENLPKAPHPPRQEEEMKL